MVQRHKLILGHLEWRDHKKGAQEREQTPTAWQLIEDCKSKMKQKE